MCCASYSWLKWFGDMSCKANQKFAQIMIQFATNIFDVLYLLYLLRTKSFFVFAGHLPTKKCKYFSFLHERPFMRATGQTLGTLSVHKIWYLLLPLIQLTSPSLLWKTRKKFPLRGKQGGEVSWISSDPKSMKLHFRLKKLQLSELHPLYFPLTLLSFKG